MTRHLRNSLLIVLPLVLGPYSSSAGAAIATLGCGGPADSALNQYCEVIPAATGGQRPHPGTPTLATSLPRSSVVRLGRAARRSSGRTSTRLLTLPAPANAERRTPQLRESAAVTGLWSLSTWLILLLMVAGVLLALIGGAIRERRQRRSAQG
jgi:hypothetical protein